MTRILTALVALMLSGAGPARPASRIGTPPAMYSAPVSPLRMVHPFDPPADPYGPGHLGVDLAVSADAPVHSAGDGVVSFAGRVAGRGLVVVQHPDGISTEYEPLRVTVRVGAAVRRGDVVGRITGSHHGCRAGRCLHWGARRGGIYLDPLLLLRPLGPVRLLPWTSSS